MLLWPSHLSQVHKRPNGYYFLPSTFSEKFFSAVYNTCKGHSLSPGGGLKVLPAVLSAGNPHTVTGDGGRGTFSSHKIQTVEEAAWRKAHVSNKATFKMGSDALIKLSRSFHNFYEHIFRWRAGFKYDEGLIKFDKNCCFAVKRANKNVRCIHPKHPSPDWFNKFMLTHLTGLRLDIGKCKIYNIHCKCWKAEQQNRNVFNYKDFSFFLLATEMLMSCQLQAERWKWIDFLDLIYSN